MNPHVDLHIFHIGSGLMSVLNIGLNTVFDDYLLTVDAVSPVSPTKLHPEPQLSTIESPESDSLDLLMKMALKARNHVSKEDYSVLELNNSLFNVMDMSTHSSLSNELAAHWGCESALGSGALDSFYSLLKSSSSEFFSHMYLSRLLICEVEILQCSTAKDTLFQ